MPQQAPSSKIISTEPQVFFRGLKNYANYQKKKKKTKKSNKVLKQKDKEWSDTISRHNALKEGIGMAVSSFIISL